MTYQWKPSSLLPSANVFLVGGAVRDALLGLPVRDHDYVVVGLTVDEMQSRGFVSVGKDFPVFLDPQDKEEYALARVERKTGPGYHGFEVSTNGVTLEDDLSRRDLTINAMAMSELGEIVDPFGGQNDLQNKVLRHVSEAFAEDPLRVLRVARFACRYPDFSVAPETMNLMKEMVKNGEVDHLVPERVWMEFVKTATTEKPSRFLAVLHECGALARVLPEVDALYNVPQVAQFHPEIDTGIHTEMVMDQAARLAPGNSKILFSAMTHDLGKAVTPKDLWPKHHDHEQLGLKPLAELAARLKVPSDHNELAKSVCALHLNCHRLTESRTGTFLRLMESLDAFRNPQKLYDFTVACEADKRGRLGMEDGDYPQAQMLISFFEAAKSVSAKQFVEQGFQGLEVKEKLRDARLRVIRQAQNEYNAMVKAEQEKAAQELVVEDVSTENSSVEQEKPRKVSL